MSDVSVVLARGAAPGESLEAALGVRGVGPLRELLARRLRSWVRATFPQAVAREVAGGFGEALAAVAASSPSGPATVGRQTASPPAGSAADTPAPVGSDGVVVIAAPELAVWREGLGEDALGDIRDGCALSFAPVFDGGLYLLAVSATALPALRSLGDLDLDGRAAMAGIVQLAERSGFEVGMLRTERGLRTADDLQALRVDPLCDDELRAVLE